MTIVLRPDQAQLKADIYCDWNTGSRAVLAVLPTGGGKSIVVSDVVLDREQAGAQQVVIAHRTELVAQMSGHIARRGIKHRIIAPKSIVSAVMAEHRREFGRSFVSPDARCSVAGVDTLVARKDELASWAAQIDDWTIDEAHHCLTRNKWGEAVAMFPRARGLGVTATPSRADGMGLGSHHDGVFDTMVRGPDMRWLIDNGALSEYQIVCPSSDLDVSDDDIAPGGDWSPKRLRDASKKSHIVGDVVQRYIQFAYGKRTIVFATDVETSGEIADKFNAAGIPAASVSAKTDDAIRREYIQRFRDGRLLVLVNVDLFDEGFDVPACECVIMARPTASLGKYLQMFGRALRISPGKKFGLIIDMVSNIVGRHQLPDKPHAWTLDRRDKKAKALAGPDDIKLRACTGCSRPFLRVLLACPWCGEPVPLPAPGGRTIEVVEGDLVLLDPERLAAMRAATVLPSPADVAHRATFAAGEIAGKAAHRRASERIEAQQRLTATLEQWAGCRMAIGDGEREIQRRLYNTVGVDVLSALAMSRADMDALSARIEGWYNG